MSGSDFSQTVVCSFSPAAYTVTEADVDQQVCITCTGGILAQDLDINVQSSGGSASGKIRIVA